MTSHLRIIDANANRAREAIRVMEDCARFLLNDGALAQSFKQLRHDLTSRLASFNELAYHRDTLRDVGTANATASEQHRATTRDVAIAASKRLGESLRIIEEFCKVEHPTVAAQIEQLRYRGYHFEQQLVIRFGSLRRMQFRLCLLLTESICKQPWEDVVQQGIEGGVDCVQLREKSCSDAALLERALQLIKLINGRAAVIINDRPDIAVLAGADGVHLGQDDLPANQVRKVVGSRMLIGVSTSKLSQAKLAYETGADYCGLGPMFPSSTKAKDHVVGPEYLAEYLEWGQLPHLAIGGINASNIEQLRNVGVHGVAVSAAICGADDPAAAAAALIAGYAPSSRTF